MGGQRADYRTCSRRFARPPLAQQLGGVTTIDAYRYDWTLNDLAGARNGRGAVR
jgi:hypothetical protein